MLKFTCSIGQMFVQMEQKTENGVFLCVGLGGKRNESIVLNSNRFIAAQPVLPPDVASPLNTKISSGYTRKENKAHFKSNKIYCLLFPISKHSQVHKYSDTEKVSVILAVGVRIENT